MNFDATWESPLWYVVQTHPKQEDRADINLRAHSVETFLPKIRDRRYNKFTGAPSFITRPLFPKYMFARFKINDLYHLIRYTRGVHSLVSLSSGPIPVNEGVIASIRGRMDSNGLVKLGDEFEPGDEVQIMGGSYESFTGVFERNMQDDERVRILLHTVNYQAHIIIERELVKKKAVAV